jgi:hypothetical protein
MDNVRNDKGIWINSSVFREEAMHFTKNKMYCPEPVKSPDWISYWEEQLRRCIHGYTVNGVSITGHHYFYLNFCNIKKADLTDSKKVSKVVGFPDFWDGDYNYFWALEIAKNGITKERLKELNLQFNPHPDYLNGGHHVIVGKSRRKGYSFKNAAVVTNTYNSIRNSLSIIGAYESKYTENTMDMCISYMNFLNAHTAWSKSRDFIDRNDQKRASYKETVNGIPIEKGYMSEVFTRTFKDKPDAARGEDAKYVLFEEAGTFANLEDAFFATDPALRAGSYVTGQILIYGTSGDMDRGTIDFAKMFYNPESYGLLPFTNIWDADSETSTCGFFHAVYMNYEGFMDTQGNSDITKAMAHETEIRNTKLKNSGSSSLVHKYEQEFPFNPSEAFLQVSINDFPIIELRERLANVKSNNLHLKTGVPCHIYKEEGIVRLKPDLENVLQPLWWKSVTNSNTNGALVVYEPPVANPPFGLYKIGYDPYRQEQGTSLACIIVYKGYHKYSKINDQIVAEYIGRPQSADSVNRIAELLAEAYNTQIMYENEVTHVKSYFFKQKKLQLLASQPDNVISKHVSRSTVSRIYGCHMNDKLKDAGEKYIKEWLISERETNNEGIMYTNIDYINSPGLLEELITYNRKGNFDRVSTLIMVMFQIEESSHIKEHGDPIEPMGKKIMGMYRNASNNRTYGKYFKKRPENYSKEEKYQR